MRSVGVSEIPEAADVLSYCDDELTSLLDASSLEELRTYFLHTNEVEETIDVVVAEEVQFFYQSAITTVQLAQWGKYIWWKDYVNERIQTLLNEITKPEDGGPV